MRPHHSQIEECKKWDEEHPEEAVGLTEAGRNKAEREVTRSTEEGRTADDKTEADEVAEIEADRLKGGNQ